MSGFWKKGRSMENYNEMVICVGWALDRNSVLIVLVWGAVKIKNCRRNQRLEYRRQIE